MVGDLVANGGGGGHYRDDAVPFYKTAKLNTATTSMHAKKKVVFLWRWFCTGDQMHSCKDMVLPA